MTHKLSEEVTNYLIRKKVIQIQDYDIYKYGLERLLNTCILLFFTIIFGVILKEIVSTIIFFFSFYILRSYTGGYHAKTQLRCLFLTVITIISVLSIMKFVILNKFIWIGLFIMSSLIIIIYSPMDTKNKPLDAIEKIIYRRKSLIVWGIEAILVIISIALNASVFYAAIIMSHSLIGISLGSEKIKKYRNEEQ